MKSYYCSIKRHYYICIKNEILLKKKYIKSFVLFIIHYIRTTNKYLFKSN